MKSTKVLNLVLAAAVGFAVNFVITKFAIANGSGVAIIPASLDVSLLAIAVIELLIAIPIFRFRRDLRRFVKTKTTAQSQARIRRVDAFYAVRVLALAKATSIFGALFLGFAAALVVSQVLLPVIPDAIIKNIIATFVSFVVVVVALLIERACRLPKQSDETAANTNAEVNAA